MPAIAKQLTRPSLPVRFRSDQNEVKKIPRQRLTQNGKLQAAPDEWTAK